jgi:hypothetical protein
VPHYLDGFKVLFATYQGMKPQTAAIHGPLVDWVKRGGVLVFCDDDSDPFNAVHEWWNTGAMHYRTPREHLFEQLAAGGEGGTNQTTWRFGDGSVIWVRKSPTQFAATDAGADEVVAVARQAAELAKLPWRESNYLLLQRGPYVIAAGLDESISGDPKVLRGRFVNLFDSELRVQTNITLQPGARFFLRDLDAPGPGGRAPQVLASACKVLPVSQDEKTVTFAVEGVGWTPAVVLLRTAMPPKLITLGEDTLDATNVGDLVWIRFDNEARPRNLTLHF